MNSWLPDYQTLSSRYSFLSAYLPVLFGTVARTPGAVVVEIGTDIGESTTALLAGAELAGGHVWSIDINPAIKFLETYDRHGRDDLWTFVCGDSSARSIARQVPGKIDVLYVDGDHTYGQVVAELKMYMPKIRGGGVALFHDTNAAPWGNPELVRVADALDDTLPGMGLRWENLPGTCGLGRVYVPVDWGCFFCSAQATEMFTAVTEKQQAFAGGSPVSVCRGCKKVAESLE